MKIIIPTTCPSCNSKLHLFNGQLYCHNESCPARDSKLVEKFCKVHSLKGFGPATLKKLEVTGLTDFMGIFEENLTEVLGETVGTKLWKEFSRLNDGVELGILLTSLSIPSLGAVKCAQIAEQVTNIDFDNLINAAKTANIGNVSYQKFVDWLSDENNYKLLTSFNITKNKKPEVNLSIDICITGALVDFKSRTLAATYLNSHGFNVKNSVTKTVKYLVCEDESKTNSSSYKKALELNIPILTINELISLKENNYNE